MQGFARLETRAIFGVRYYVLLFVDNVIRHADHSFIIPRASLTHFLPAETNEFCKIIDWFFNDTLSGLSALRSLHVA
jgi:hypothetical protein